MPLNRKTVALRMMCARLFVMLMNLTQSSSSSVAAHIDATNVFPFEIDGESCCRRRRHHHRPSLKIVTFSLFTLLRCRCIVAVRATIQTCILYYTLRLSRSCLSMDFFLFCWVFFLFSFDPAADKTMIFFFRSVSHRQHKYMQSKDAKQKNILFLLLMGILKFIIFICVVVFFVYVYLKLNKPQAVSCDVGFSSCFCLFSFCLPPGLIDYKCEFAIRQRMFNRSIGPLSNAHKQMWKRSLAPIQSANMCCALVQMDPIW